MPIRSGSPAMSYWPTAPPKARSTYCSPAWRSWLDGYRVELQKNRDAGAIGHQRHTMTEYPFLAVDDSTFVMLRHQWALDRLCGEQLFFEAWARLGRVAPGSASSWR